MFKYCLKCRLITDHVRKRCKECGSLITCYNWDDCPNIDLRDKRVLAWNESAVCILRNKHG
jgi:hypothetical protein